MAVKGIGSNYLYPAQNDYTPDSKAEDIEKSVSYTTVQSEGVCYEKTISDSVSAGLEFMQGVEKQLPGTKFFVGTVSYGQTYGNSSDINFVVNPKFLGKLGTDETVKKQFEEDVKFLNDFARRFREQQLANGREIISQGWFCDENRTSSCGGMRTANAGNSSVSKAQDKSDSLEERIRKKREEKEEMEARLEEKRKKKEEFEERLEEMRLEREAYLEHFIDGNSSLKQYQSIEITQTKSYFDANA